MKILQIASGSKGNSTYIESGNTKILIDCGISKKRIHESLSEYNHNIEDLDAILITHEHTDHTSGIIPLFNATNAKFYMTEGTYSNLNQKTRDAIRYVDRLEFINNQQIFKIGDLIIETIQIFHDAIDPVGFIIRDNKTKLVYITDTGYIHKAYVPRLMDANIYIMESNHDPEILMNSNRPYETKMRILSDHGHLSNEDSAYIMSELLGPNTKYVLLAHISEECNLEEIALDTYKKVFNKTNKSLQNAKLICCSQKPLKEIEL